MKVYENILLSSLTTMRIGGPARYCIEIEHEKDIPEAYGFAETYWLPTFVLGGGANTIGHDEGFNGVILMSRLRGFKDEDGTLTIAAGEPWDNVVAYACDHGYTGIEAMSKIPGLTGAAPVQNIGAYGQDLSSVFVEAKAYDTATRGFVTLTPRDLQFAYRRSALNTTAKNRFFITTVTLKLRPGEMPRPYYNSIENYLAAHPTTDLSPMSLRKIVSTIRTSKLPDPADKASAGSFFKNVYLDDRAAETAIEKGYPVRRTRDGNKLNSAWLIEQVGLKGQLLHGIRINPAAPLNLINESAGSYANLAAARAEIVAKVYDKFGYWLEQEPVEIIDTKGKGAPK